MQNLKNSFAGFWKYRYLLQNLITRDFKLKYRRSVLGVAWSVLNPLLTCLVMWAVFGALFNQRGQGIEDFPLFLIMGIIGTGICMRYFDKVDIAQAKVFIMGILHFTPQSAVGLNPLFFTHVALVSVLLIYFPFSKLMHMGGIFMSPTRNMRCNTREVRHVNPWNNPNAPYRTYAEYEDDFRDLMAEAGLPLEKQPEDVEPAAPARPSKEFP